MIMKLTNQSVLSAEKVGLYSNVCLPACMPGCLPVRMSVRACLPARLSNLYLHAYTVAC